MKDQNDIMTKKRIFNQLGYLKTETEEITGVLNKLLANYSVHYQKLRNFHWNVKGQAFFDLHVEFEKQYNEAIIVIDEIAERVRVFGRTPLSTMREYLNESQIEEPKKGINSSDMVKFIIEDYHLLMDNIFEVIELSLEYGDSGTEDMMKGFIKTLEKHHWILTTYLSKNI